VRKGTANQLGGATGREEGKDRAMRNSHETQRLKHEEQVVPTGGAQKVELTRTLKKRGDRKKRAQEGGREFEKGEGEGFLAVEGEKGPNTTKLTYRF